MSKLSSFKKHMSERHVWIADETQRQKILLSKKLLEERAAKDEENLMENTRRLAEELVAKDICSPKEL